MVSTSLDDLVRTALQNQKKVELDLDEEYGYVIKVEGTRLVNSDEGMPTEMFEYPLDNLELTNTGKQLLKMADSESSLKDDSAEGDDSE